MDKAISRRAEEKLNRINQIRDTAERLFAQKGFFNFTMKELARKAEFALGTIYSYFQSKSQLYDTLIEGKTRELVNFVSEQVMSETTITKQLEKFIEAKLTFFHQNPDFIRLYFSETYTAPGQSQPAVFRLQQQRAALSARLTEILERGIKDGTLIPVDAKTLTRVLMGLTDGFVFSWIEAVPEKSLAIELKIAKHIFLDGVLLKPRAVKEDYL
ncbi:hypothetical protein CH330_10040 [candidate division WOR-3 bacterium JGI_Cruoil_03_51_56]|uniref:HTH tetR-type domain-containing protein n=1 Tax=candidate division WOR-3 bacterium JGI_Cruoil_03_51_56 TaxID=1973747 RepID=A0A235BP75_UNCW3|nr:MAG: hypothetical protein CH330_10040 [candidate division WOR-3 bacterium JGI_Cruoil_03_51_56]